MTEVVLYGVAVSAFVAKVRIALDWKGLTFDERTPPGGYGSAAYRAIVAAGSVPGAMIDGRPLHDSNAIIEYLETLQPAPPLFPVDPYDGARARALLGFHDTRVEAATRALFPLIKGEGRAGLDDRIAGVEAAWARLADLIAPAPFAFGASPSIADMAYPVTIQMAEIMVAELAPDRGLILPERLRPWREATAALAPVRRSLVIAEDAMEVWMAGFRRP